MVNVIYIYQSKKTFKHEKVKHRNTKTPLLSLIHGDIETHVGEWRKWGCIDIYWYLSYACTVLGTALIKVVAVNQSHTVVMAKWRKLSLLPGAENVGKMASKDDDLHEPVSQHSHPHMVPLHWSELAPRFRVGPTVFALTPLGALSGRVRRLATLREGSRWRPCGEGRSEATWREREVQESQHPSWRVVGVKTVTSHKLS